MATQSIEAKDRESDLFTPRPASLFPAGLKVARGSARERAVMFAILVVDCICWAGLYVLLSELSGNFNRYGWAEVLLPTAISILSLSLIGGYNPRSDMKSVGYFE
jgi:hypothetical protein